MWTSIFSASTWTTANHNAEAHHASITGCASGEVSSVTLFCLQAVDSGPHGAMEASAAKARLHLVAVVPCVMETETES